MFPSTSSRETLRFSGNKIHCSPRDNSLSVYCFMWRKNDKLGHPRWPQFLTNCTVFLIFSKNRTSIRNHKANGVKSSYVLNNSSSLKRGSGNIKGKRIVWCIFDTTFFYPRRKSLLKVKTDHRSNFSNLSNWKNYCDDHSSLFHLQSQYNMNFIYIYIFHKIFITTYRWATVHG